MKTPGMPANESAAVASKEVVYIEALAQNSSRRGE
jgi:hypothetical protein